MKSMRVFTYAMLTIALAGCSTAHSPLPSTTASSLRHEHAKAGRLARLSSQPPDIMQMQWLMTDGSVLAQSGSQYQTFYRYVPDAKGNYEDGTWSKVGSLPAGYKPSAFAAQVLADGRLAIIGGEYVEKHNFPRFALTNLGAIYDPGTQTWKPLGHPQGWNWIGDSPSSMLADGRMLLGNKLQSWDAYLDPKTLAWESAGDAGKADWNAEEGWTLLSDGTILTLDVLYAPNAEIYDPAKGQWKSAGSTIADLHSTTPDHNCLPYGPNPKDCYYPAGEIGPAMLRPDGTVFCTGSYSGPQGNGAGHTAIYYSTGTKAGTWIPGPDFPNGDNAGDNFAVLEPSGNVLVFGDSGALYEWNGTTLAQVSGAWSAGVPLLLPTGQIMMTAASTVALYTPTGSPSPNWAPTIASFPGSISSGHTYKVSGTQFNGLSQAMAFGDENQNATNYPLVRITNAATGDVFYARTHDHSTMGVATGSKMVWTYFDVPAGIEKGSSTLVVVANGIASKPVTVNVL